MAGQKKQTILLNLAPDKRFWLKDGRVIKNLYELSRAFEEMDEPTYKYHANESKNDFSNWVLDLFGEKRLANRLTEAGSRERSQIVVLKHLVSVLAKK